MKRLITAIIAISYLCLSTGLMLHVHYCMGQRTGASFFDNGHDYCGHCGMKKKRSVKTGCCNDQHLLIKGKTDISCVNTHIHYNVIQDALVPQLQLYRLASAPFVPGAPVNSTRRPHGPPLMAAARLYVYHCTFLI